MEIFNRDSLCVMYWGGVFTNVEVYIETSHCYQDNLPQSLLHFIFYSFGGLACHFFLTRLAYHGAFARSTCLFTHSPPQWRGYRNAPVQQDFTQSLQIWDKVFNHFQHFRRPQETLYCTCFMTVAIYTCFKKLRCELAYWGYTAFKKDKLVTQNLEARRIGVPG